MIDDQPLIDVITQHIHKARPYFEYAATYRRDFSVQERAKWLAGLPSREYVETPLPSIQAAMQDHPIFRQDTYRCFGAKQLMLRPIYQASKLLRMACTHTPTEAVAWMRKVYATTEANVRYIVEVHGLKLDHDRTLSNGVRLVSLEELPPSEQKEALIDHCSPVYIFPVLTIPSSAPIFPPIGAIYEVYGIPESATHEQCQRDSEQHSTELECAVRAFALAGDASPVIGFSWAEFMDPELAAAEVGHTGKLSANECNLNAVAPYEVNDEMVSWVERYLHLPTDVRKICDVAIERLTLARRRRHPGNQAIEGAICLEALLGNKTSQELTYRLRLRAALLLATTLDERREISNAVRDFYRLRSETVHGISVTIDRETLDRARRGLEICAEALRVIVLMGKKYVPQDWELAGGQPNYLAD